jgi:hypothetical protein
VKSFKLRAVALAVFTTAVLSMASLHLAGATVTPRSALIYGDSLTFESRSWVTQQFATKPGWVQHQHEFPGFALCDFQAWLPADLAAYHPSVVAVETAGNYTRPCMTDANGNQLVPDTDAFYAKYRADIHAFFKTATDSGATVVWMTAPPMLDAAWNARIIQLTTIAKQVAASYPGVSVSTTPRNAVSNAGTYTATKPCGRTETAAQGCGLPGAGLIWIRTVTGTQTGVHFCPAGLDAVYPHLCLPTNGTTYSSGEYRWGGGVASTVVKPPAAVLPTVTLSAKASVEGQPLLYTPKLKYPYSRDLTLCSNTSDGTATVAAGDYTPLANTCVTLPAWTTVGPTIPVATLIDHITETSETVKFNLWSPTTPIVGGIRTISGTIKANAT